MKLLFRVDQELIFKDIVDVLKVLATKDGEDVTDAIVHMYEIARELGVEQDLHRITETNEQDYKKWTEKFSVRSAVDNLTARSIYRFIRRTYRE